MLVRAARNECVCFAPDPAHSRAQGHRYDSRTDDRAPRRGGLHDSGTRLRVLVPAPCERRRRGPTGLIVEADMYILSEPGRDTTSHADVSSRILCHSVRLCQYVLIYVLFSFPQGETIGRFSTTMNT